MTSPSRPTFAQNQHLLGELEQLRRCVLSLSAMGAVVQRYKSGCVVLIDEQHVPGHLLALGAPVQQEHHRAQHCGCTVIWKAIKPTTEDV